MRGHSTGNQEVYRRAEVAELYAREAGLFPPEETILRLMLPDLRAARMLDLGVGGGRTTVHFAKQVREYVGADYSETMIQECRTRFATSTERFVVCDARSMAMFASESFDFVLFSMNGIDSVNHADRLRILKEVRRVGKAGGWFCFSSHNLNFAAESFKMRKLISVNPRFARRTARRLAVRFVYNWRIRSATLRRSQYQTIDERFSSQRMPTYYVRPEEQLRQLSEDFSDVRVFSFDNGREFIDRGELQNAPDMCLYYLCRTGK
jgi:ubiquinone/menaquinone biosynthesis C-methylase UbiE